jgi:hypothetical protein
MISRSTRGVMANPAAGLMLKFQFNPHIVDFSKKPEYELQTPAGWDRPIVWYLRNGERHIEFDLTGDATAGSMGLDGASILRPFGVRDQIATIESFMLPQTPMLSLPDPKSRQFIEPPDCYFIFGLQWAKTKVVEAPIKQMLFDKDSLTPSRFTTRIKLLVIEDSAMGNYDAATRSVMSLYGSAASAIGTVTSRLGLG